MYACECVFSTRSRVAVETEDDLTGKSLVETAGSGPENPGLAKAVVACAERVVHRVRHQTRRATAGGTPKRN